MSELTQTQKNKLLAAAEIVEHGDVAVLKKLLEFQDFIEEKQKELEETINSARETTEEVRKETDEFLRNFTGVDKKELTNSVNEAVELEIAKTLSSMKKDVEKAIKSIGEKTKLDLDSLTKGLYLELNKVKNLPVKSINYEEIYAKIKEVESKIVPAEEIKAEEVRDSLETLEGDERLKVEAIEGTHRITVSATKPNNPQLHDLWLDIG